jgi:4-hydroxy-3-methylbut-2-en-1-yl diphosphate synthase IspG/GcpE
VARPGQAQKNRAVQDKYDTPLVADIHFQPAVALMAAEAFEKIRVNPGNFADGRKKFDQIDYDDPAQARSAAPCVACSLRRGRSARRAAR